MTFGTTKMRLDFEPYEISLNLFPNIRMGWDLVHKNVFS